LSTYIDRIMQAQRGDDDKKSVAIAVQVFALQVFRCQAIEHLIDTARGVLRSAPRTAVDSRQTAAYLVVLSKSARHIQCVVACQYR